MGMTYSYSWYKRQGNNVPFIQHHHIHIHTHTYIHRYIHTHINISYKILCTYTFSSHSQQYGNFPTSMRMVYQPSCVFIKKLLFLFYHICCCLCVLMLFQDINVIFILDLIVTHLIFCMQAMVSDTLQTSKKVKNRCIHTADAFVVFYRTCC